MILHDLEADAVLFDCDGVLVDSEPISYRAWRSALMAHGFDLSEPTFHDSVGGTEAMVAARFAPEIGADPVQLELEARKAFTEIAPEARGFDDSRRLIARLESDGIPMAVATNGLRWRLDVLLRAVGLEQLLPYSVTADEVSEPKPSADLYLAAAGLARVDPQRCVVFEDSPTGIAAARAAGCRVIAVDRGMFPAKRLRGADVIVSRV